MTPESAPPRALHSLHAMRFEDTLLLVSAFGVEATGARGVPRRGGRATTGEGGDDASAQLQVQPAGDALLAIRIDYLHGVE